MSPAHHRITASCSGEALRTRTATSGRYSGWTRRMCRRDERCGRKHEGVIGRSACRTVVKLDSRSNLTRKNEFRVWKCVCYLEATMKFLVFAYLDWTKFDSVSETERDIFLKECSAYGDVL